jgi:hypothetical protein
MMPKFLLTDSTRRVDFVAENEEGDFGELLDGEEGVKLCFRFVKRSKSALSTRKDDSVDFREVVAPETAG